VILSSRSPPWLRSARTISPYPISTSSGSTPTSVARFSGAFGSSGAAGAWTGASGVLLTIIANMPASVPTNRNGALGIPGISPSTMKTPAAVAIAFGWASIWLTILRPMFVSDAARVTIRPVAVEIRSAGICVTRPSPTVRRV